MKNIFSWSVLVSFFTVFFYWFGYWYKQGYISYFGHDIEVYDIPVQHVLISGFLHSTIETVYIIIFLLIVSFYCQFSRVQLKYYCNKIVIGFFYVIILLEYILKKIIIEKVIYFYNYIKNKFRFIERLSRIFNFTMNSISMIVSPVKVSIIGFFINFNHQLKGKKSYKELRIHNELIKEKIDMEKLNSLESQYSLHSFAIIGLLSLLLLLFRQTIDINREGYEYAESRYYCTIKLKENCSEKFIEINFEEFDGKTNYSNFISKWYLTDICTNQKCVVFSTKNKTKLIDITDKSMFFYNKPKT